MSGPPRTGRAAVAAGVGGPDGSRPPEVATGPVQETGSVISVRRADAYYAMSLVAPGVAERFRPGQFAAVAVGGPQTAMLARRAFSIYAVRPDHGGTVEFVFAAAGPGTQWLAARRARDEIDITGPLGRPFPVPREPASCLLVGGGYGSAPLFALSDRLRERGCTVDFLLGAATSERVFGAPAARRAARTATVTTEDGSLGTRGRVTDVLPQLIREGRADVLYACGPMPMLREVSAIGARYGVPAWVAVEESMACGIGVCMTCVLPITGRDGVTRMLRACVDGPVFRGGQVRFDDVGTIPFDAYGAPGWSPPDAAAAVPAAGADGGADGDG